MKSGKALKLARVVLLGLANGVFSSAIGVTLDRINFYYALQKYNDHLADVERSYKETGTHFQIYNPLPPPLWWIRATCVNIALFTVTALIVHLYIVRKVKSVFLLWQTVGLLVIIEWAMLFVVGIIIDVLAKGRPLGGEFTPGGYAETANWEYVIATLVINAVWGLVMKASAGQYAQAQRDEANSV